MEDGRVVRTGLDGRLRLTDSRANAKLARALHDCDLQGSKVSLPFFTSLSPQSQFMCQTTPLSEADGPHPWIGPTGSGADGFTLLILSPIAPRVSGLSRQSSMG